MQRRLLLLCLWLPLLALPWAWSSEAPFVAGFRMGWLLMLPLFGLTIGLLLSTFNAIRHHRHDLILPGYQSLDALAQIRRCGLTACLLLPACGACGVSLLLPAAVWDHSALSAMGMTGLTGLAGSHVFFPALAHPLPLWSSGLLLLLAAPLLWPEHKRTWGVVIVSLVVLLLCFGGWRTAITHPSTRRGWLMAASVGGLLWVAFWWGLRRLAPQRPSLWAWRWGLGLFVLLYHVGLLVVWWQPGSLDALIGWLLLLTCGAILLGASWYAARAILHVLPDGLLLRGRVAYNFGASWPLALVFAWVGWLYCGGSAFGQPIQQHPLAMLLILAAQTIAFGCFSALDTLHSAKLHPPSRTWLLAKPLLLYLTLALTLGMPAMAILKGSF